MVCGADVNEIIIEYLRFKTGKIPKTLLYYIAYVHLHSHLAVSRPSFPGTYVFWIGPQGHGPRFEVRSRQTQDHVEQSAVWLLHAQSGLSCNTKQGVFHFPLTLYLSFTWSFTFLTAGSALYLSADECGSDVQVCYARIRNPVPFDLHQSPDALQQLWLIKSLEDRNEKVR